MGSLKGNGRFQEPARRRNDKAQRRRGFLRLESLEERTLLSGSIPTVTPLWHATNNNLSDVKNGPMANEGSVLIHVYQAFENNKGDASTLAAQFPTLVFKGNMVAIGVNGTGDFNAFVTSLTNLGVQVAASSAAYGLVQGFAPIAQLPKIATLPQTLDAHPTYKPTVSVAFQGVANNEGQQSLGADVARQQFSVDGTGVTVGVLSDSVSLVGGGLADSYATGDLSATNPVKVIQEGSTAAQGGNATDEGRGMLENIHDIAPGASLQFGTADDVAAGEVGFMNNIVGLANAGSNVIVDDVSYPDEPVFQDGLVAQGVTTVTNMGRSYFSSEGNTANQGYLSNFRSVSATVGSLGQGTFMNFDPGTGVTTQLPVTIGAAASATNPAVLAFQFDQPYATQEPAGDTNAPTSEVDFYVLDSSGKVAAVGNDNNIATRAPFQIVGITAPGNYTVVMQLVQGTAPKHVEFYSTNENVDVTVSPQFGTAGGTSYPTAYGHHVTPDAIGVGAVPWFATTPFLGQNPLKSEPFSSFGPSLRLFNADGTPATTNIFQQTPVVSGPDGGNTSFFGQIIDTSNAPFPGEPSTPTNLSQNLPSFFGTSSAAPNVAAVAALMLQHSPGLTEPEIRSAMIASATPLNGSPAGTWNAQGGFGLVNAVKAITASSGFRVASTSPSNGQTVTVTPSGISVTFNKPVNFSTVTAADLKFTSTPPGVTATVGTPFPDPSGSQTFPTTVIFPFSLSTTATTPIANGVFTFSVQNPATGTKLTSQDGQTLNATPTVVSFTLNDVTAPVVTNTSFLGRQVVVTFSKPIRPSSFNTKTAILYYQGPNGAVDLSDFPGVVITHDSTDTVFTIDYSALNQSQMPSGTYVLRLLGGIESGKAEASITDQVGNDLDGVFHGSFPSGGGDTLVPDPAHPGKFILHRNTNEDFIQLVGPFQLTAPVITSLNLTAASDTGIKGDLDTKSTQPSFIGQVSAPFPGTVSGLNVYVEFDQLNPANPGTLDLTPGSGGRGTSGNFEVIATTNANGTFTFTAPKALLEGYHQVTAVVVGQADSPVLPGLSSSFSQAFRIDTTAPYIQAATLVPSANPLPGSGTNLASLSGLSLEVVDPSNPPSGPYAVPVGALYPALDPSTADNISNYTLINTTTGQDESSFITNANFVPTGINKTTGLPDFTTTPAGRLTPGDPYTGRIDLTFAPGLPKGTYELIAHTSETVVTAKGTTTYTGLADAAGNPLDDSSRPNNFVPGSKDFTISFNVQPTAAFITNVSTNVNNAQGNSMLPRSYYELNPRAGDVVSVPPTTFNVDFSNPLATTDPTTGLPINFNNVIELVRSADNTTSAADGDFGNLGVAGVTSATSPNAEGFTQINNTQATLVNGPNGPNTRLVLTLAAGTTLPADHYRFYLPNVAGQSALYDIYGNQVDGEFLGAPSTSGFYQDFMPDGSNRGTQAQPDMSGDGTAGGAFMTGFVVVNSGNLIYARPDYVENPQQPATFSDGSISKPYAVLAPQAAATAANGGDLNNPVNFNTFNSAFDRAGSGHFDESAFYAAQVLSANGPVVIVALPGTPTINPTNPSLPPTQPSFVLQAPKGTNPVANDGSASVPADTSLFFTAGTTVKLQNASLFAQNQGSWITALGSPTQNVTFTSNSSSPAGGDWGGIVFRSFDQAASITDPTTGTVTGRTNNPGLNPFPVDGTLKAAGGQTPISGADDSLDFINFAKIIDAGGNVPSSQGFQYSAITAFASRPFIANTAITGGSPTGGAGISGDLDSFRADDVARGMIVRNTTVTQMGLNGIWIRPDSTGAVEQTDALPTLTNSANVPPTTGGGAGTTTTPALASGPGSLLDNPVTLGGTRNYVLDSPLPYILTSVLDLGQMLQVGSNGTTVPVTNRLSVFPGMIVKSEAGAGIKVLNAGSGLVVGDQTYIHGFDSQATIDPTSGLPTSTYGPLNADGTKNTNFKAEPIGGAPVIFTSALDAAANTSFLDPVTGLRRTIVPAVDSINSRGIGQPLGLDPVTGLPNTATPAVIPATSRWGGIEIASGALAFINGANIDFAGGALNLTNGGEQINALQLDGSPARNTSTTTTDPTTGLTTTTTTMVPGFGARAMITNNNFFYNTDVPIAVSPDALLATDPLTPLSSGDPFFHGNVLQDNAVNGLGVQNVFGGSIGAAGTPNLTNNSVWDATDITYVLRDTITPANDPNNVNFVPPPAQPPAPGTTAAPTPVPQPWITLTIHSQLPGTLLPDGSTIAQPGAPVYVKAGNGGGFSFGVDTGANPPPAGINSQLRILGIGGNENSGQQRVPAVLTSINDNSVGPVVRGVSQANVTGGATPPAPGDGGNIAFGGLSLTTFNAFNTGEGDKVDNADISYFTAIQAYDGGIQTSAESFPDQKELTISDSRLSHFSLAAIQEVNGQGFISAGGVRLNGERTLLFTVNDTIFDNPIGVKLEQENATSNQYLALNNTFFNNGIAIDLPTGGAVTDFVGMDNIFDGNGTAVLNTGDASHSLLEYNLFFNNTVNAPGIASFGEVDGDPAFLNAAAGDFRVGPTSAAINAGRDTLNINPDAQGAAFSVLVPLSDPSTGLLIPGNSRLPGAPVSLSPSGQPLAEILTLPGYALRGFADEFSPALNPDPTNPNFVYTPITGQRDSLGFTEQLDQQRPVVGNGANPYYTIGAYAFRQFNPPQVTQVTATVSPAGQPATTSSLPLFVPTAPTTVPYAGTNQVVDSIQVKLNHAIDPATVNGQTVLLEKAGNQGFGAVGVGPGTGAAAPTFINLSGKVSFNPATSILTVNLAAAGVTLGNGEYRLILVGTGASVLKDLQGNALDGEDTSNGDDPNGTQQTLPSGDGFPGGNFYVSFIVNNQPSTIQTGTNGLTTFKLDPGSDTNLVGDNITLNNLPSFSGTIAVANPLLATLAGQTAFVDVSNDGGRTWTNVGSGTTDASGNFLVPAANPLPNSPYTVGANGLLNSALNASLRTTTTDTDDSGYTLARVRVVDQNGNATDLFTDPLSAFQKNNAVNSFVVDTAPPHVTSITPATTSPLIPNPTTGQIAFSFTTDKNLDPTTVTPTNIQVIGAGVDGLFGTTDDVTVPVNASSIKITPLKTGTKGPESVAFTISAAGLNTGQYQVTLKGTGSSPIIDIAGNPLDGTNAGLGGSDFVSTYVVSNSATTSILYVGPGGTGPGTPTAPTPQGTRVNPYATIQAAITAATPGETVAVLPGTYTENVTLSAFVNVVSAAPSSTDAKLVPGNALVTVIRAPLVAPTPPAGTPPTTPPNYTVQALNLSGAGGAQTELSGFTIAAPLVGNQATGTLDLNRVGVLLTNSSVLLDRDYIIDSHIGVSVVETGLNPAVPTIQNDVIVGNGIGVQVDGTSSTLSLAPTNLVQVVNDTFAFNNVAGLYSTSNPGTQLLVSAVNNIFAENHSVTRSFGTGVASSSPNAIVLRNNMFSGNGPSATSPADDTFNVGNGFNPAALSAFPDSFGNFTGVAGFVNAVDPRPDATTGGPAAFFLGANFDITAASGAVDAANNAVAPTADFLRRGRVDVAGRGFAGTGPADVGAFEFQGSGGSTGTGGFQVTTDSLSPTGAAFAHGATVNTRTQSISPIKLTFSANVLQSSVTPSDLVISGSGVSTFNPVRATNLQWIDAHTVDFFLSGNFNPTGTVNVSIPAGAVTSSSGASLAGFSDSISLNTPTALAAQSAAQANAVVISAPAASATIKAPAHKQIVVAHPKAAHLARTFHKK